MTFVKIGDKLIQPPKLLDSYLEQRARGRLGLQWKVVKNSRNYVEFDLYGDAIGLYKVFSANLRTINSRLYQFCEKEIMKMKGKHYWKLGVAVGEFIGGLFTLDLTSIKDVYGLMKDGKDLVGQMNSNDFGGFPYAKIVIERSDILNQEEYMRVVTNQINSITSQVRNINGNLVSNKLATSNPWASIVGLVWYSFKARGHSSDIDISTKQDLFEIMVMRQIGRSILPGVSTGGSYDEAFDISLIFPRYLIDRSYQKSIFADIVQNLGQKPYLSTHMY
ncbi:MAG: hypothetical protein EU551_04330 [Promethearchaeota archaeon]|nr:MAG: hypothetical protein EU551_04330 [Candidatus Lokiarchaeota archaeon]